MSDGAWDHMAGEARGNSNLEGEDTIEALEAQLAALEAHPLEGRFFQQARSSSALLSMHARAEFGEVSCMPARI